MAWPTPAASVHGMLHVAVSDTVRPPRRTVLDVYGDYAGWPDLFPTISGVRLLRREGDKLVLEVDHVEGKVLNELLVRPPDTLDLWEEKRHYDARFLNRRLQVQPVKAEAEARAQGPTT